MSKILDKSRTSPVAWLSLIIGGGALFLTLRNQQVVLRPYVGVTDGIQSVVEGVPRKIVYQIETKNVGSIPAFVHVIKHEITLIRESEVMKSGPRAIDFTPSVFLMPGQGFQMNGAFAEGSGMPATVADIVEGKAYIDIYLELEYDSPGLWGTNRHHYKGHMRVASQKGLPLAIGTTTAEAD
jgi:hypothetical protein